MKKNILLVTSEFPPEPGGIGNHAYNLAKYLTIGGFKVEVISDQRSSNTQKESQFDSELNFNIKRIKLTNFRFFMYLNRIVQVFKETRKNQIIIASGKFSLWIVALMTFIFNKKFIAVVHGTEVNFSNKILKKSIDISLKKYTEIIAVSNFTKSLLNHLKLKPIHVIPNGFELLKTNKLTNTKIKGIPSLITVGNVTERKGQINVIKSLPYLKEKFPKVHYHIVGKPTEKKQLLELANKLKVENHITFHGKVTEENKVNLLASSDIFIMLSENTSTGDVEGFGIAVLEANSLGIPAIGAEKCGIEDAIDNYSSGILINNKDSIAFSKAISQILDNYPDYEKQAVKWSNKFDWNLVIKKYIDII